MVVPGSNVRAQKTVRCMIGLVTFSLLAACPHPADGLSAGQSPLRDGAGSLTSVSADTTVGVPRQAGPYAEKSGPCRRPRCA
jgi:hypothetical protein